MKIQFLAVIALALGTTSPSLARESSKISRPENIELISSVGDTLVRVQLRESLPNAFGGADIFGRKRDRGLVVLTYHGLRDGRAVIRRRSIEIVSNETTMSRSGAGTFHGSATSDGQTAYVSGFSTQAPQASVIALPPDTIEVFFDPIKGGVLTVEDRVIEIISADDNAVHFKVRSNQTAR